MKLLHVADLHLGKRVFEFDLTADQKDVLDQVVRLAALHGCAAILVAGDVYDKSTPPADAVGLLDDFLTAAAALQIAVFMISGNHDSPERMAFGNRLMDARGVHIAGVYDGSVPRITLTDEFGPVSVHLLPFVKPIVVRQAFPNAKIESYDDALKVALGSAALNPAERNVLVSHQFVTAGGVEPERSESEHVTVGEIDNVDASRFDGFDYVALGHIHKPQRVLRETLRYAGSPLKYSFSEVRHVKSAALVELKEKGNVVITLLSLKPLREMREIKGRLAELRRAAVDTDDYIHAILTDEETPPDAMATIRAVYPNVMKLDFDNARTRSTTVPGEIDEADALDPIAAFLTFFNDQNGRAATAPEIALVQEAWRKAGEAGR